QFGKGDDAVVVVFGRLLSNDSRDMLWWQLDLNDDGVGTIAIDNADGALEFYDIAGNREFKGEKQVTLQMNYLAHYIKAPKGGPKLIAQRLAAARIDGVRPVEIIARDFTTAVDAPGAKVNVTLHNLLNRAISGKLAITPPAGIVLKSNDVAVKLDAGRSADFAIEIAQAKAVPANAYLFAYAFTGEGAKAEWKEVMHVLLAKKGKKTIDGSLDDWANDLGVLVDAKLQKVDPTQQYWMPFIEAKDKQPDGSFGEVKLGWDDDYLYIAARVNDPTDYAGHQRLETWDENQYFRSAKDDAICETLRPYEKFVMADMRNKDVAEKMKADPLWPEYEKFLKEHADAQQAVYSNAARVYFDSKRRNPAATFGDATYVYKSVPWNDAPWAGDVLQMGFDVLPDYAYNLKLDNDRVPWGFHAMPDTDYEYSVYACPDGKSELWRLLAPGVPRGHYYPRQPRAKMDQCAVAKSRHAVKREGTIIIYEAAIPWAELKQWKPKAGQTFGCTFRIGNNKGPSINFGANKSAVKTNGLSLHPYWEGKPSCGVRWVLGQ
ncbi:MAG TPA: hypothetical protein VMW48_14235, partial [Vicinamibacterales bacterium]|nr:hypothetical protein [Vicinamibacterales bacterium]